MSKVEINVPEKFPFSIEIPIRRIDLSLDLHVSFASILDLVMEAHLQFLQNYGYSPTDIHGTSVIFANANIIYQGELLSKDQVRIEVAPENFFEKGFDYIFRLTKQQGAFPIAIAKIRVLFFDYKIKKVTQVPTEFRLLFDKENEKAKQILTIPNESVVWREAHNLVIKIYNFTKNFPKEEMEHLTSRIRKAATSLPLSIMEASSRTEKTDIIKILGRCRGYIEELRYYLILANDLKYVDSKEILNELENLNTVVKSHFRSILNTR